jgi:hypothetical protein
MENELILPLGALPDQFLVPNLNLNLGLNLVPI